MGHLPRSAVVARDYPCSRGHAIGGDDDSEEVRDMLVALMALFIVSSLAGLVIEVIDQARAGR
jgi:hypothetical protein